MGPEVLGFVVLNEFNLYFVVFAAVVVAIVLSRISTFVTKYEN